MERQPRRQRNPASQVVFGLLVIALGVLFLLDNLGVLDFRYSMHFWPLVLVAVGILKILQTRSAGGAMVGGALILFGGLLTLKGLGLVYVTWRTLWPILLIGAGLMVVYRSVTGRRVLDVKVVRLDKADNWQGKSGATGGAATGGASSAENKGEDKGENKSENKGDDAVINVTAVMGSYVRRVSSQHFRGGEVTAVMGGCELDLRQCSIDGEAVLDVFALFGGIQIKVPADWTVVLVGTPIMGGFDEKTSAPPNAGKRLLIKGYAIMGGLEVRN
ncbi:LiaI-LiaF-like domain-containing protein [Rugamonas sp. CCM 8940]|uniref:LiaI-LiaF-like domain-containing protein n=1 Tax=Rugamonas sp. CCM 8940 TaxID=2765359 RepID=UPI001F349F34|nr:DUF5668 domain-containing protein [Rugamonas sp. CCM 8940]